MESVMNKLLEDVITQILLRLPVKSLLRFKGICKAWCNLIKTPDFIAMHCSHCTSEIDHHVLIKRCLQDRVTNVLSVHSNTESLSTVSPDLQLHHFHYEGVKLLGPCNGLVCITNGADIVLCNPAIREFSSLPLRPFGCPHNMYCSYDAEGFGYDANTNDYKVIRVVDITDKDDYNLHILKAELYQCSTHSWREIVYDLPYVWNMDSFNLFFCGATHWYSMREGSQKILSFCISTEVFQEFDLPESCPFLDQKPKSLTVLNESLVMLSYTSPWGQTDNTSIDVWMMREYGVSESWTKQFTIEPLPKISHPITSWKNSALLLEKTNGQLISCVIDTHEVREYDIFSLPTTLRAMVYKESLVSIRKGSWGALK